MVGNFGFLNSEFKIFLFWGTLPVKANKFFFFFIQHIGFIYRTIPRKIKSAIPFIYFIGKPFLEDSPLLQNNESLALKLRQGALSNSTTATPFVEFGLTKADLF